jgi:hypothetical protein
MAQIFSFFTLQASKLGYIGEMENQISFNQDNTNGVFKWNPTGKNQIPKK